MNRYRIKLKTGRVIGPLLASQFNELFEKKHIDGSEKCQEFPSGDWLPMSSFSDIKIFDDNKTNATFLGKLNELNNPKKGEDAKTLKEVGEETDSNFPKEFEFSRESIKTQTDMKLNLDDIKESSEQESASDSSDKTIVKKPADLKKSKVDTDKTMINPEAAKFFEEQKKKDKEQQKLEEERELGEGKKKAEEEALASIDYENESTQMISLDKLKDEVVKEANEIEHSLQSEKSALDLSRKKKLAIQKDDLEKELFQRDEKKSDSKKKKIYIFIALALAYILFGEDGTKKKEGLNPIYPEIKFPVAYEVANNKKSIMLFEEAMAIYNSGHDYLTKLKASRKFLASIENNFDNNSAMAMYILSSSEILNHAENPLKVGSKIFKLIEISRTKFLDSLELATGMATFFANVEKPNAAIDVIEKYTTVTQPSLKMFGVYLGALIKAGNLSKARSVYDKVSAAPDRSLDVFVGMINFNFLNDSYDQVAKNLQAALNKYPNSVELLLLKAKYDTYKEDLNGLKETLVLIEKLGAESSVLYTSKFHEYLGLYYILNSQNDLAVMNFKKALKFNDSSELRTKLASIEEKDLSKESQAFSLVLESKALDFMSKAEVALKKEDLETALNFAVNAVDISNSYIPAKVLLAKIQIKKGFFEIAIKSLEEITKNNPLEPTSNFALLNSYSESFKFNKARNQLSIISNSNLKDHPDYPEKVGLYFYQVQDYLQAISWFSKAVDAKPLDEINYYRLGQIFFYRKNFKKSKSMVKRAIELNPRNSEFRVLFSNILYEMDSVDTALGYLRDIALEFSDSPEIQGQIAIYYFRSGQLTRFEEQKNKMEASPNKTEKLYDFLIKASLIDEKFDDVIDYGRKLLAINPGNLETRMLLGRILFEKSKYEESLSEFKEVRMRLPTYPKLLFYISKIYLMTGQVDEAVNMAKKELEANPDLEDTYILLGDIAREREEYIQAEKYYKEAQQKNSESPDALLGLAFISSKKNQFEVALDLYKKAASLDVENVEIHKYLGDTYRNLGQGKLAIESYKVYLELKPESKYKDEIEKYIRLLR